MTSKPTSETQPVGPGPPPYQTGGPAVSFAPQPQAQLEPPQTPSQPPPLTNAQIGEQYRAECDSALSSNRRCTDLPTKLVHARCAQGYHDVSLKFGLCGILTAIVSCDPSLSPLYQTCLLVLFPYRAHLPFVRIRHINYSTSHDAEIHYLVWIPREDVSDVEF